MSTSRTAVRWMLALAAIAESLPRTAAAQVPVIEESGLLPSGVAATPGGSTSLLGQMPGAGADLGMQPGRGDMLLGGRPGPSFPRVPSAITMPGGAYQGPQARTVVAAPQPMPTPRPPFLGTLEVGPGQEDLGPPDGLTLDQAIEIYVHQNLNLRALALELPQARADVITAGLRANPILYADSQLIPYEQFSRQRPGGPTQYDLNISHPIDYSGKRRCRMNYAEVALRVMELQYEDAVRRGLGDLYLAYVDVLAARRTVHYARVFVQGTEEFLNKTLALYQRQSSFSADVDQARSERAVAAASLADAEEALRQRKRALAALLNLPPADADRLELRGSLEMPAPPLPPEEELLKFAMEARADVASYRLGVDAAQAAFKLARANRFADAYLLFQPFTFQDNSPYGVKSATSWAMGITVPLPVYNRNQGNIERARINIDQSQVQLIERQRQAALEVQQAIAEYRISGRIVAEIRDGVLPYLRKAVATRGLLLKEGEADVFRFLDQRRIYNDRAKSYIDSTVRHRKAALALNTAVGQRIVP